MVCSCGTRDTPQYEIKKLTKFRLTRHIPPTKVFAITGMDIGAIGNKSLIGFSSGWTLIIKRQMLSSKVKQKSTSVQA